MVSEAKDMDDTGFIAPAIPGFEGWAADLRQRAEAVGDGDIPLAWTPEHVGARLVEAFQTLRDSGGRVGPGEFGNGWPTMLREFSDLVDPEAQKNHAAERSSSRSGPTSEAVSRMNEALAWPMRHLDGKLLQADALLLWAFAVAHERDLSRMLHHRKKQAVALASEMMRRHNEPPRVHDGEVRDTRDPAVLAAYAARQAIAREVARLCNEALAAAPAHKHAAIRAEAQAAFRARCRAEGCLPLAVKPHEATPGRVLNRWTADRQRKLAMATIATRLRRAGVTVR